MLTDLERDLKSLRGSVRITSNSNNRRGVVSARGRAGRMSRWQPRPPVAGGSRGSYYMQAASHMRPHPAVLAGGDQVSATSPGLERRSWLERRPVKTVRAAEEDLRHVRMGDPFWSDSRASCQPACHCRTFAESFRRVVISTIGGTSRGGCTRVLRPLDSVGILGEKHGSVAWSGDGQSTPGWGIRGSLRDHAALLVRGRCPPRSWRKMFPRTL